MKPEYRMADQIDANQADADIYRLASKLDGMAARHGQADFRKAADIVARARSLVRKRMHKGDLEATHG